MAVAYPLFGSGVSGVVVDQSFWRSGGNVVIFVLSAIILGMASLLIFLKIKYGRILFSVGWIVINLGSYVVRNSGASNNSVKIPDLVFCLTLIVIVVFYLYFSPSVRRYFSATESLG
ncbi:hypothetical protein [Xanthomonas albilineans]|nr:hypothetical protein [Xanthomonas albilineans]